MSRPPTPAAARRDLADWEADRSRNAFRSDAHLRAVTNRYVDGLRRDDIEAVGRHFGKLMAGEVPALVAAAEASPPRLERHDAIGRRTESVVYSAQHHAAGAILWDAGLVSRAGNAGNSFEQAVLAYLASHEGEMGHLCAATCTTGLIRVIRRAGSSELRTRFLPRLTATDAAVAWRGAQYLTEVQGGSDVGANAMVASAAPDGTYRLSGEKWFCSVAEADVFLVMARPVDAPDGTAGLGCFVVPRLIDGEPNAFAIHRLKEKLGTVSMASAEIEFEEALAYPVGDLDRGFKIMVTDMLNTSRWLNALGDVGMMRRAYVEAASYARHRRAFGRVIGEFPLVRRQVAELKAEWLGALHSTWALTALDEAVDLATAGVAPVPAEDAAFYRFLVNANKLVCSEAATNLVRGAIEVLGGNGAIETFSVLPRLLRDCVVYEQWEGTHNVLAAQVLRDFQRLGTTGTVVDHIATMLKGIGDADRSAVAERVGRRLDHVAAMVGRSMEEAGHGAWHFRGHLGELVRAFQAAHLLETAERTDGPLGDEMTAAAEVLVGRYLDPGYEAAGDGDFADRIARLLGSDLHPAPEA
jgi:alkylation response protein AidB-like acyl-CoA dehydrogenase